MTPPTTLHFVRHGKVDNRGRIYYGRLPGFHLSSEGLHQATAAAKVLRRYQIVAIYSSPLERAIETAEELAKHLGMTWRIAESLNEAYTPWDGCPIGVVKERKFDVYTGSEPRFEQPTDVLKRAQRCALTLRRECQGQHVVAVTHGDVIAFMMLWAMGRPITPEEKQLLYQSYLDYASITSFTYETILGTEVPEFEYIKP